MRDWLHPLRVDQVPCKPCLTRYASLWPARYWEKSWWATFWEERERVVERWGALKRGGGIPRVASGLRAAPAHGGGVRYQTGVLNIESSGGFDNTAYSFDQAHSQLYRPAFLAASI